MSGIATAIVGSAVISGYVANKASKSQQAGVDEANDIQREQYAQQREDFEPWRQAGLVALDRIGAGLKPGGEFDGSFTLADFTADPGYEFRRGEGMRGVETSAAARGGLLSGGTLKALARYNQNFASNEYSNAYNRWNNDQTTRFNRLSSLAGIGQTATRDVATLGGNMASAVSNNVLAGANARASGYVGVGNAINQGVSAYTNYQLGQQYLNRAFPQPTPSPTGP